MDSKNIIPCIICCIFLGGSAIFYLYGTGRLITLKNSHETVNGSDENEKGIIAKKLYDLGKMYYWRFIPRDKIL